MKLQDTLRPNPNSLELSIANKADMEAASDLLRTNYQ